MAAPTPPTGTTLAELQAMFDELYAAAAVEMKAWMERRVPSYLMEHYDYFVGEAPPPGLQPNQVVVTHGDSVRMVNSNGIDLPGSPGICAVGAGALNGAQLQPAPTYAIVQNGGTAPLMTPTMTPHPDGPAIATVSASTLQNVRTTTYTPPAGA